MLHSIAQALCRLGANQNVKFAVLWSNQIYTIYLMHKKVEIVCRRLLLPLLKQTKCVGFVLLDYLNTTDCNMTLYR